MQIDKKPGSLGDHMRAAADRLDREAPDRARMLAREEVARIVRHLAAIRDLPFNKGCRYFVELTLPVAAAELPEMDRLLRHAGFGGADNTRVTVDMLRAWDRDARLPPPETIDITSGWLTAAEATSLVRAHRILGLPTTVRGMEMYLEEAAAKAPNPAQLRRGRA